MGHIEAHCLAFRRRGLAHAAPRVAETRSTRLDHIIFAGAGIVTVIIPLAALMVRIYDRRTLA